MPELVVSNDGERELLRIDLQADLVTPRVWHLRLFTNDYTPNRDTVVGDLTEAAYTDYAPVPIDPALWTDPVTVGGAAVSYWGSALTQFAKVPSGTTVYGYFLTFANGATLLWSQRWDTPLVGNDVDRPSVWPQLTGRSEFEPVPPP